MKDSTWGRCSIGYQCKTCFKLKSREILLIYNVYLSCHIVLKKMHGASPCPPAKLRIDLTTEEYVMGKRDLERFEFKMSSGRVSLLRGLTP